MTPDTAELWFCQDCEIAECNGDYSGMDDARAVEVTAGFITLTERGHLAPNSDSETGEGMEEFSRRQCDACGTHLAGYRARFAQFLK
jgi:hypothetical protein